jgi:putative membrane protein
MNMTNPMLHPHGNSLFRIVYWAVGILFAAVSVAGPLAHYAHTDFSAHMLSHLFLGMLAPLLIALSAPMTLALQTLSIPIARRLSLLLRSWPSRMLTHPIIAATLHMGGLWLLYTTPLYSLMYENQLLHVIVHFHIFLAGYLFIVAMIYIDPTPHRFPFQYRASVMMLSLTGHGILSKYIYAHPPMGVPIEQAELGGMLMYYGGDAIHIVLIFVFCLQWYRATQPRVRVATV